MTSQRWFPACFSVAPRSVMMVIFFVSFSNSVSDLLSWHKAIASSLDIPTDEFVEAYKSWGCILMTCRAVDRVSYMLTEKSDIQEIKKFETVPERSVSVK